MTPVRAARDFLLSLSHPARILVALSGGSDSTGLLLALSRAAGEGGRHALVAATVDHGLRAGSAAEAQAAARLCASLGISHIVQRWTGEKPSSGLPAAARNARYRLLAEGAKQFSADCIVTAHTADDQDETVLMRAARVGAAQGPGLAGIAPAVLYDRSVWVFRPFLGVRRQAIRAFLTGEGVGWSEDPSNTDPRFERVRMRSALSGGGVAAPDAGPAAANRLRLSAQAAAWTDRHVTLAAGAVAHVAPEGLRAGAEVMRFALAGLVAFLGGRENGPSARAMGALLEAVAAGVPVRMTLGRVLAILRRDGLHLVREARDLPELALPPGGTGVWDGRFLFVNPLATPVLIMPGAGQGGLAGLAPSLARHALRVLPRVEGADAGAVAGAPRIAPYDLFLPVFDLAFASSLARLAGREAFTAPATSR